MTHRPIDFSNLEDIEIPVKIRDRSYVLREATGEAAACYQNAVLESTVFGSNGKPKGIKNLAAAEALLVSHCLFDVDGQRVTIDQVNAFPSRVKKALFETAKQISQLQETGGSKLEVIFGLLDREDSPLSLEDFERWMESLDEPVLEPLLEGLRDYLDAKKQ